MLYPVATIAEKPVCPTTILEPFSLSLSIFNIVGQRLAHLVCLTAKTQPFPSAVAYIALFREVNMIGCWVIGTPTYFYSNPK